MLDDQKIREIRLLMLERTVLFNKLFERNVYQEISQARLDELEKLSKQQPLAIIIIGTAGEIIPSYLGLCMNLDRSSLSRMIDSLENKDIVRRRIDPNDRRRVPVSLTEKGKRYYEILNKKMEEVDTFLMGHLEEQDIKDYEECLKTEVRIMKKIDSVKEAGN
ncbi:MarR family transcriptional regulator [Methanosarcina sp. 2.H.T.1A.6]|uniref:MarR family winged helix-turn-helix transcriptional regulator n=1 Tax=unclassified Methanosarcina TaxID=2644672 RepID=UPI0006220FCC|nr:MULTISPECIES: MarR family transcriptional regulator [unclassified Methanosarcina]KKG16778.1 MarR family transcriptional regulator [Methanosarcina sp. 2.H.T.1A.3]KKG22762.1 MarR family transcriptional regulator [Methanosarcina sp. 2.H.T.1A.6]KKG22932.1 MarR family transcriptional regulator [Methanosarcina sp. 2.H.T.1A.15]KKG24507.1 MarR family transcriptional regulator [Methanosarcina sp. 2.H.T.1A.8]